jgi:hypothetical protein
MAPRRADMTVEIVEPPEADYKVQVVGDQVLQVTPADAGKVVTVESDGTLGLEAPQSGTSVAAFVGCKATRAVAQTISSGIATAIAFTSPDAFDTDGFHDPAGAHPERVTIPVGKGGKYALIAQLSWSGGAANTTRETYIRTNGDFTLPVPVTLLNSSTDESYLQVGDIVQLADGDYLELIAFQGMVTSLNTTTSGGVVPHFLALYRIGD